MSEEKDLGADAAAVDEGMAPSADTVAPHVESWAENHALTLEAHAQAIDNNRSHELIARVLEPRLIAALRAGADALRLYHPTSRSLPAWQPIETAPRDGTQILGSWGWSDYNKEHVCDRTYYADGEWRDPDDSDYPFSAPTHWMPLPAPPVIGSGTE